MKITSLILVTAIAATITTRAAVQPQVGATPVQSITQANASSNALRNLTVAATNNAVTATRAYTDSATNALNETLRALLQTVTNNMPTLSGGNGYSGSNHFSGPVTIMSGASASPFFKLLTSDGLGGFAVHNRPGSPNIIGGYLGNYTEADNMSIIAGGGSAPFPNTIEGAGSIVTTISGGYDNHIGAGGILNNGIASTIAGGGHNRIYSSHGFIGGGSYNSITGVSDYATIPAGTLNLITGSQGATISGGIANNITGGDFAFIAGGESNSVTGARSAAIGSGVTIAQSDTLGMNFSQAYFLSGGPVGIGVSPPDFPNERLDVGGTIALRYDIVSAFPTNKTYSALFSTKATAPFTYPFDMNGHFVLQPRSSTGSPGDIVLASGAIPTRRLVVTGSGNVGVNVSAPTALFQVVGSDGLGGFAVHDKPGSPNIVGGYSGNFSEATNMSIIAGGGIAGFPNTITGAGSTITTISGGYDNHIGTGGLNTNGQASTIAGGGHNRILGSHGFIGGGSTHKISGLSDYATIGGGAINSITNSQGGFIGGGSENSLVGANYSFISGGLSNSVSGARSAALGTQVALAQSDTLGMNFSQAYFLAGGPVGIGVVPTDFPNEKLDVAGALSLRFNIVSAFPTNKTYSAIFSTKSIAPFTYPFDANGHLVLQPRSSTGSAQDIVLATGAIPVPRVVVTSTGSVGIGTNTPAAKLHAVGGLLASNVTVYATTNQLIFGATNIAPSSAVAPTKWVSVQIAGDAAVYRLPLYE